VAYFCHQCHNEEKFDDAAELMSGLRYSSLSREGKEAAEFYELLARAQGLIVRKQSDQAIPLVLAFKKRHPDFKAADDLLREAETSAAFDSKDYDTFLAKAREEERAHPGEAHSTAQVASALACKYAATGDEQFRKESLEKLEEARKAAKDDEGFKQYEARIMHRLRTREIIDKEEYDRKFRKGSDGRKGKAQ
jgi:hypothetical protein